MKKIIYTLSIVLFMGIVLSTNLFSQTTSFIYYGVEQGLSQSQVQSITQDDNGNLWIGTLSGLTRYNGREFKTYSRKDSLAEDWVTAMCKDSKGNIWFGHWAGGISMYNGKTDKIENLELERYTQFKTVTSIVEDKQQRIWIATEGAGIFIYDIANKKMSVMTKKDKLSSDNVYSICEDGQSNMWIATDNGITIYNTKGSVGVASSYAYLTMDNGLLSNRINTLALVNKNEIWAGSGDAGVQVLKTNAGFTLTNVQKSIDNAGEIIDKEKGVGADFINCIYEDNMNNVWVGTTGGGVTKISPFPSTNRKEAITKAIIYNYSTKQGLNYFNANAIFQDKESNIWIGTDIGLNKYRGERFQLYDHTDSLVNNLVWTTLADRAGNIWIGTNEGISKISFSYSPVNHKQHHTIKNFTIKDGLSSSVILSSFEDKDGNLWFGTGFGGVCKFDITKKKFETYNTADGLAGSLVFSISDDKDGNLWFGTKEGASKFNPIDKTFRNYTIADGLGGNNVYRIFKDSKGNLWFGALGGALSMYDGTSFKMFGDKDGIHHKFILCINEDKKHNLWFGAYGGGVYKYDGNKFINYSVKDGLATDSPYSIICDNYNRIWIGSSHGIDKFDITTGNFTHYGKQEGFPGVETNPNAVTIDNEGNLWYGTIMGAVRYCPREDKPNLIEPQTVITGIKLFMKATPFPDDATFAYNQNDITFNFVGTSLTNPDKVKYQYKLDGYDKDWTPNYTLQNEAVYTNLPPGTYTFMVKACNNDNTCNISPTIYKFKVYPPFWKTTWFYILVGIAFIVFAFVGDKIRTRKLKHDKKILENKVDERTRELAISNAELAERNKDITDSIRYAKRIQEAILPPEKTIKQHLTESFIFYKPKDIVSGDFYWVDKKNDTIYFAAVDCTGHGVPGAFMSIVGHNLLNHSLNTTLNPTPAILLDKLNKGVSDTLKSTADESRVRDGMDIALCSINLQKMELHFAGAYNPAFIVRGETLIELKGDNIAIGTYADNQELKYNHQTTSLQKGDLIYVFSDGYADQFGGPNGKKFKIANLKALLLSLSNQTMSAQHRTIDTTIEEWRKDLMQVDDMLIIGVKII